VKLYDVNVLVYAHRTESSNHARIRSWLEQEMSGPAPFMMSELVLAAFVRVVTNPRIFEIPTPLEIALTEAERIRGNPLCLAANPGQRHFEIFTRLCREGDARGKLTADAYLAALAIETGCRWITFDRDFARFPRLDWGEPDLSRAGDAPRR
jgi:toxin-antitoxin system PIN domain toxin